jgi:hypothetical protein
MSVLIRLIIIFSSSYLHTAQFRVISNEKYNEGSKANGIEEQKENRVVRINCRGWIIAYIELEVKVRKVKGNGPWGLMWLLDVKALTFSKQLAQRWR